MKIHYLETVDSTQTYLKKLLQDEKVKSPYAVVAKMQTAGKGSRDNSWIGVEGNLFLSFALPLKSLPNDLKLESASIYFAYILKMTLEHENSQVWLKWPNDFYLNEQKVGGMITHVEKENFVCGVGLNIVNANESFAKIDIEISIEKLLEKYFENLEKEFSWKQIFSKYKLEFYKNQNFSAHEKSIKISLGDVHLEDDGSVTSNGIRIYSRR